MSLLRKVLRVKGFTLVELLVVIAIIGILVALVMPAISTALLRGKALAGAANGRSIHQMFIAADTEDIYNSVSTVWPILGPQNTNSEYESSTAFFSSMIDEGSMNVAYSFFALPGTKAANTKDEFLGNSGGYADGEANGWCIVADAERIPDTAPMLFSRNFRGNNDAEGTPTDFDSLEDHFTDGTGYVGVKGLLGGTPYRDKAFVFTTRGGGSFALLKKDLQDGRFNNLFRPLDSTNTTGAALDNDILRPGAKTSNY